MTSPSGPAGPRPNPGTPKPTDLTDERAASIREAVAKAEVPEHIQDKVLALFRNVRAA